MKLDTTLFNAILEQVKSVGPDEDCNCSSEEGPFAIYENLVYKKFLDASLLFMWHEPIAAFHTMVYIGFVSGLQYAKVSQEVKELDKLVGGERCD